MIGRFGINCQFWRDEDRIMSYHVSPGGQEAKCQVDVSLRNYKGALASRKELTNRVEELLMQLM